MERESFKQRMRNLKSYQDNNPGKGYWDWKVQAFEDGGEVKDPPTSKTTRDIVYDYEDNLRKIDKVGKRPLEEGLKPAFNLEDFANFTPVGDALSVKDTYDAVRLRDWLGTGLAAVGMLPFVPNMGKMARGSTKKVLRRETPGVVRSFERQIDNADRMRNLPENDFRIKDKSDIANTVNRIVEGLDPEVYERARKVDSQYGTKYTKAYDTLKKNYDDMQLFDVHIKPNMYMSKDMIAGGKIHLNDEFEVDVSMGSPIDDIRRYEITANPEIATASTINHEMGHIVDVMQAPGMERSNMHNNPLLKDLENADNFVDFKKYSEIINFTDPYDYMGYQRKGSEIKSFMNLTRRNLLEKGKIKNLSDYTNEKTLSDYMYALPRGNSEKALYDTFKDSKTYLKWFNTIPVVGLAGAAYINKLHDDNKNAE